MHLFIMSFLRIMCVCVWFLGMLSFCCLHVREALRSVHLEGSFASLVQRERAFAVFSG